MQQVEYDVGLQTYISRNIWQLSSVYPINVKTITKKMVK